MKLGETARTGKIIGCFCAACLAKTPLDPRFFLVRRGDVEIEQLKSRVVCGGCGSKSIDLVSLEPEHFQARHGR